MTDEDLTRLLHDAVADVQPRRSPGDVDDALGRANAGPRWLRGAVAAAAAVVVVTAGAAYLHERAGTGAAPATGQTVDATVYFLGRTAPGDRLFGEHHTMSGVTTSLLQAAVQTALGTPDDPDYFSGFAPGTRAFAHEADDGTVVIDFASTPQLSSGSDRAMALQSLVWTVDGAVERPAAVRFTVGGQSPDTLLGAPNKPLGQAARDATLAPVSLDVPEGALLKRGSRINGMADAFEANVVWTLRQGNVVVRRGFATANTCCTLSPFAFTLDAPPGAYTLSASDTDPSGGEGHGVTTDTKTIQIE